MAKPTCGTIHLGQLSRESRCGRPAVAVFDTGKPGGYPVCAECAPDYHPTRVTWAVENGKESEVK